MRRSSCARACILALLSLLAESVASPASAQPDRRPLMSNRVSAVLPFSDGALYGTARGLFARTDSGVDGTIEGFTGFVTGLAELAGVTLVGSTSGPAFLARGVVQPLRTPGSWTEPFVNAVATADSRFFFGGPFGLAEAVPSGGSRELTTPGDLRAVEALAGSGTELLVAFDGGLYGLNTRREEWKALVSGVKYSALAVFKGGKWVGVRADGGLDEGFLGRPGARRPVSGPFSDDAVSAVAATGDGYELLVGTMRGRIFVADPGTEDYGVSNWNLVRTPSATDPAIRALASLDRRLIRAGTDGAGILEIDLTGRTPAIKTIVSSAEPIVRVEHSPERPPEAAPGGWAQWRERLPRLKFDVAWAGYAAAALIILALAAGASWVASRLGQGPITNGLREKRRATRTPVDLPTLDELSPDIADYAGRFHEVTQTINELSRDAARGTMTPGVAHQARKASQDFEEIDNWMRNRLLGIRSERVETQKRLHDLKARIRDGGADESGVAAEVAQIEDWMAGAERDEKYLRYVLEE